MRVGIQGGKGSFNEEAFISYCNRRNIQAEIVYLYTTKKVLEALDAGQITHGQFAIYNTHAGLVRETRECLGKYTFQIIDEYSLPVSFAYMKHKDVSRDYISYIASHEHVFLQCSCFISEKLSELSRYLGINEDPAHLASQLHDGSIPKEVAILGPKSLSRLYDLEIIEDKVENISGAKTHFVLVTK